MSSHASSYRKYALLLSICVILLLAASAAAIFLLYKGSRDTGGLTAKIYQDGSLLRSIPLSEVTESYSFEVTNAGGGTNTVEVRPGEIGIIAANCPDKLCVSQGFIHTSLLPVTCLPNRLVIQVQSDDNDSVTGDIITH